MQHFIYPQLQNQVSFVQSSDPVTKIIPFTLFLANSCCKPTIPEHSKFYSDNRYNYGDKVFTQCNKGYVTGGTEFRVCQNNGQWSGSQTTCTSKIVHAIAVCNFDK